MNQILSVDMPKNNNIRSTKSNGNKKASTKSVLMVFSIILLIFGIIMFAMGIMGIIKNGSSSSSTTQDIEESSKPRIDITQNASQLDIEISAQNNIQKVEYSWNDGEIQTIEGSEEKELSKTITVPSGANTLKMTVTDIKGITSEYSHEYVGAREPNVSLHIEDDGKNKIKIKCNETETIKTIAYFYDNEQETKKEINDTKGEIETDIRQGVHDLTVRVEYENGTIGSKTAKVLIPTIEVNAGNGKQFVVNVKDENIIKKVKINFNGQESEETVDNVAYSKTFNLQEPIGEGNNRLIITVYNSTDGLITQRIWDKNN